jgi:dimeric dUTPase (all-alpha-NTP-PPase superfamily)
MWVVGCANVCGAMAVFCSDWLLSSAPNDGNLAIRGGSLRQALINMLTLQDKMNSRVHEQWIVQDFQWYRAIWIECGELIEHFGYKWWKKQETDLEQVRLEVIDIWHFGMSALFTGDKDIEQIAGEIEAEWAFVEAANLGVQQATEELALHSLQTKGFSPSRFWELMLSAGLDFDSLYSAYVGKNVLNFFRQDNGYKDGSYVKNWAGKEDNEHLVELVTLLDKNAVDFSDQVYRALATRYQELVVQG